MTRAVSIAQGGSNNVTMRNRIINGGMVIDQRNAGGTVNNTTSFVYTLDRWQIYGTSSSKFRVAQSAPAGTLAATGFSSAVQIYSLAATTVNSSDIYVFTQTVEGYNWADISWGTANAQSVTLSFWVYSSLTGTFGGYVKGGGTYTFPFSYTVSSANTWEKKTVTISGQTAGTWGTTNNAGAYVGFSLGTGNGYCATANTWTSGDYYGATGQTNFVSTNAATMYITGVQLEAGTTATPFEQRLYGTELALCQRYCEVLSFNYDQYTGAAGFATTSAVAYFAQPWTQVKRAIPSITFIGYNYQGQGLYDTSSPTALSAVRIALTAANLNLAATYSGTNGQAVCMRSLDNNQKMIISAEL